MPEVKPFGIAKIREHARKRVSESSLRAVAAEIGTSFSGLRKFLDGADPHAGTIQKLTDWYLRSSKTAPPKSRKADRSERAEVDAAIQRLERYLEAGGDPRVARERRKHLSERLFGREL
jgi:hypothetical protein